MALPDILFFIVYFRRAALSTSKLELRWPHSNKLISFSRRRREKKEREKAIEEEKEGEEEKETEKAKGVLPEPSSQDLQSSQGHLNLQDLQTLQNLQNLQNLRISQILQELQKLQNLQDPQNLQNPQDSQNETAFSFIIHKILSYAAVLSDMKGTSTTTPSPSPAPTMKPSPAASAAGAKRKRNTPGKYYAVKKGYRPGVYFEWNDCLTQVTGYKGAVCKLLIVYIPGDSLADKGLSLKFRHSPQ